MHTFLLVLACANLTLFFKANLDITRAKKLLTQLQPVRTPDPESTPQVSLVIPACNEEQSIQTALASVVEQNYPHLEIIAVNDRSTDRTGCILDEMTRASPRLRVLHIQELPPGWLGKNHALHLGAQQARGEWIIFADADVIMHPSAVTSAIRYACEHELDHLAAAPKAIVGGWLANVFLGAFALLFTLGMRAWKVRDPRSKAFIGIGAFNMVRASAYRTAGGHAPISMRPDDDLKLGKWLKQKGFRSDFALATSLLTVHWYWSWREMRNGLMKNFFAVLEYDYLRLFAACTALALVLVWPFAAILFTHGPSRWISLAAVLCACGAYVRNSAVVPRSWIWSLTLPLAGALTIYLMLRAAVLTTLQGGITWRGTKYPLAELRCNRV